MKRITEENGNHGHKEVSAACDTEVGPFEE